MNVWQRVIWLSAAGALGTLARYGLSGLVQRVTGSLFPWGTLAVNGIGSFLFGLVWVLAAERMVVSGEARLVILTGFMGAFTTFSTFSAETGQMLLRAQWAAGMANLFGSLILGLLCFFLGLFLGRLV